MNVNILALWKNLNPQNNKQVFCGGHNNLQLITYKDKIVIIQNTKMFSTLVSYVYTSLSTGYN